MATKKLIAEPKPEQLVAIIDTREQTPLDLSPLRMETGTLATGDYSLKGLEHVIAIERKSLSDLLGCCGGERERFEREIQRMLAYPVRCLVIESTWETIETGLHSCKTKLPPQSVIGSLLGWSAMGLPILMAGSHSRAGKYVGRLLFIAARRRWREARQLVDGVLDFSEE
jgi:DNA excision repair protein ERCC-4